MELKINEKNYPLQWGMGCLEMFCDALDCEILDIDKALFPGREQIKYLTTLFLCALKNGAKKESYWDDFEVSYRDLQAFIDDSPEDTVTKIIEDFNKSKYFGKTMSEYLFATIKEEETENNKSTVSKKKSPSVKS